MISRIKDFALEFYIWLQNSYVSKPEVPPLRENVQYFLFLLQRPLIPELTAFIIITKSLDRLLQSFWYPKLQNLQVCHPLLSF